MATDKSTGTGFRISDGLLTPQLEEQAAREAIDLGELPRAFGAPLLFVIARDPRTLFVYWNIDWPATFGPEEPKDRQVFLRVIEESGLEESESLIEPLLGSFYAPVAKPSASYKVELGYYPRSGGWKTVATSDPATTPPDSVSKNEVVDVATVPFHLSFQKMIDLFCESNGDPLTVVLSRIQKRALGEEGGDQQELHTEEREILRAMNLTVSELRKGRQPFATKESGEAALRKRAEAILGMGGSTSPTRGFGESSWS